jgi:hypothetical protein
MLESLRSVEQFLDTNADKLAGVVNTGARQRLTDAIAGLSSHAGEQTGNTIAAKGATQKKANLRLALIRDHMAPIARIAAADLPHTPELAPLKLPRNRPTAPKLAALAHGMAVAAAPFADTFTKAALPADFIAQLNSAADALVDVVVGRTNTRGKVRGATKGLKATLNEGRNVVHILDALLQSTLKDDPALLANWKLVRRVTKTSPGRAPAAAASTTPSTAPNPTPATEKPTSVTPTATSTPASPTSPLGTTPAPTTPTPGVPPVGGSATPAAG